MRLCSNTFKVNAPILSYKKEGCFTDTILTSLLKECFGVTGPTTTSNIRCLLSFDWRSEMD